MVSLNRIDGPFRRVLLRLYAAAEPGDVRKGTASHQPTPQQSTPARRPRILLKKSGQLLGDCDTAVRAPSPAWLTAPVADRAGAQTRDCVRLGLARVTSPPFLDIVNTLPTTGCGAGSWESTPSR